MLQSPRAWVTIAAGLVLATVATWVAASAVSFGQDPPAQPVTAPPDEVVRAVFLARCGSCHGSQVKEPDGKFGFVDNLEKLGADPEFIVRGSLEKSYLWDLVSKGDMPPPEDPGQPTADEKNIIKAWILHVPTGSATISAPGPANRAAAKAPPGPVAAVGRFHVLIVHFPIALFVAALFAELLGMLRPALAAAMRPAARYCIWIGALGAVATALTGWAGYLGESFLNAELLESHKLLGTIAAVLTLGVLATSEWRERGTASARTTWIHRGALLVCTMLISLAAHWGGQLVHGIYHLPLPF
ncbi:MAG: DUF2231 domain-containing protein [Planctomycetota bacterium]